MKTFKRYCLIIMALTMLVSCMLTPSALSFAYDWDVKTKNVYFQSKIVVSTKVDETVSGNTKSDVKITNTGTSPCYVKAMIVFTPIDKNTSQALTNVTIDLDNDVTLNWSEYVLGSRETTDGGKWLAVDSDLADKQTTQNYSSSSAMCPNLYVWTKPLNPDESTENLLDSLIINTDLSYNVRADIIADAIYEGEINNWCDTYGLTCDTTNRILAHI